MIVVKSRPQIAVNLSAGRICIEVKSVNSQDEVCMHHVYIPIEHAQSLVGAINNMLLQEIE